MTLRTRLRAIGGFRLAVALYVLVLAAALTYGLIGYLGRSGLPATELAAARLGLTGLLGAGLWLYPWALFRGQPLPGGLPLGGLYLLLGSGNLWQAWQGGAFQQAGGWGLALTGSAVALLVGANQFWPVPLLRHRAA